MVEATKKPPPKKAPPKKDESVVVKRESWGYSIWKGMTQIGCDKTDTNGRVMLGRPFTDDELSQFERGFSIPFAPKG